MDMTCEEQCGGVCEICSRTCENCGDCADLEPDCPYPGQRMRTLLSGLRRLYGRQRGRLTLFFGWFQRMFDPNRENRSAIYQ